jgi:fibronectin-binding autotransporter adhesin
MAKRHTASRRTLCALLAAAVGLAAGRTWADVVPTGDVVPATAPSTWTTSTSAIVGDTGAGSVTVNGGSTLLSGETTIGNGVGASGTVTADGVNSAWTNSGNLWLGKYGAGALNIVNGGSVSVTGSVFMGYYPGSTGVAMVDGSASSWTCANSLNIGSAGGSGTLSITNGGSVATGFSYVRSGTDSTSMVIVDGSGSIWAGGLSVANNLYVTNGGRIKGSLVVAGSPAGTVTVDGNGSSMTGGSLSLGATKTLNLTNGALVTCNDAAFIAGHLNFGSNGGTLTTRTLFGGSNSAGTGIVNANGMVADMGLMFDATHGMMQTLNLTGAGQNVTINLNLNLPAIGFYDVGAGAFGTGTLTIRDGKMVSCNNGWVGYGPGSTGTALIDGTSSKWTPGSFYVGYSGNGMTTITSGANVTSRYSVLGYSAGSAGALQVDGTASSFTNTDSLLVGKHGDGTLTATNGGKITSYAATIGCYVEGTGIAVIDGVGSAWSVGHDPADSLVVGDAGAGTLVLTGGGKVTENNPSPDSGVFLGYQANSKGVAIVDGTGSVLTSMSSLYVGCSGNGMMTITHGGTVTSYGAVVLGRFGGSSGTGTVDGTGSRLTCAVLSVGDQGTGTLRIANGGYARSGSLYVGLKSTGTVRITNGGYVSSDSGLVSAGTASTGTVIVDGAGSTWANNGMVQINPVGPTGKAGFLLVQNGGQVTSRGLTVGTYSMLSMTVGDGSKVDLNGMTFVNHATVRLKAAPNATAGSYTPVLAAPWTGTGTVQALGGTWDAYARAFTVNAAATGAPGTGVPFDRTLQQRVVITNPTSTDCVQVGFMETNVTTNAWLTAWELNQPQAAALAGILPAGHTLKDGWTLAAEGYTDGEPVFLSLKVGTVENADNLAVWHYNGATWEPFAAGDLSYDGTYASFTVTGFSGYAVTAVPEAPTLGVFALLGPWLMARRRRGRGESPLCRMVEQAGE